MAIERVAIVFDDELRPETTGGYCLRALKQLVAVEHFRPAQLESIRPPDFDLFLNIDDGLEYDFPANLHPCAFWAVDTHLNFTRCLHKSRAFDHVFAAQRNGAERLAAAGVSAEWLPLACDPEIHGQIPVEKVYDLCFIGNLFPGERAALVHLIQRRFQDTFVGRLFFEEMARTYSASRIVFNRSLKDDINMRVFEALASGSLLLTNELAENGQQDLFRDGVHFATYHDAEDLVDKSHFYLERADVRERIAAQGRSEVLARHTYLQRMAQILKTIEGASLSVAKRTPSRGLLAPQTPVGDQSMPLEILSDDAVRPSGTHSQSKAYFDSPRPELLAMIPASACRILEIGCGTGRLGASIKARQRAFVTGIELNEVAASLARQRLDRVIVGNVESLDCGLGGEEFDCVICGDVLEHLRQPDRVLRRIHSWLAPGGHLVASIPNVRNHSVLTGLFEGNWTYESAGLLDNTHLRFFTRLDIEQLLDRSEFEIAGLGIVPSDGYQEWIERGSPGQVRLGRVDVIGIPVEEAEEFYVYQYLIDAIRAESKSRRLTTIIVVTHNELAYTRQCVESVENCTDEPFEFVFVDNGSTDGTVEYLRGVRNARLIANADHRGFPAAVNQGIAIAQGDQLLLLNNDVVVATGWLRRLLDALESDPKIGLVGPITNCTSGLQRIDVPYQDLDALEKCAWTVMKANRGRYFDAEALMGFCLLIRTSVVRRLGALDERFELGLYDDVGFSLRARQAGFRVIVATDVFVHHFGQRSAIGAQIVADHLMQVSEQRFAEKWENAKTPSDLAVQGDGRFSRMDFAHRRPAGLGEADASPQAAVGHDTLDRLP